MIQFKSSVQPNFKQIPGTRNRYVVNLFGDVFDNLTGDYLQDLSDKSNQLTRKYKLDGSAFGNDLVESNFLVMLAYKGTVYLPEYMLSKLSVLYPPAMVLSSENLHDPSIGFWGYCGEKLESAEWSGYRHIPSFSRYVINSESKIINTVNGTSPNKEGYIATNGYVTVGVVRDDGKYVAVPLHFLAALAWCEYDNTVIHKQVNHLDSTPLNPAVSNLEWTTPKENVDHQLVTGVRSVSRDDDGTYSKLSVKIKDIYTDEVRVFSTVTELADWLNVKPSAITHAKIPTEVPRLLKKKYLVCEVDREFPVIDKTTGFYNNVGKYSPKEVVVTNLETGEKFFFDNAKQVLGKFPITKKQLYTRLGKGITTPLLNYTYSYI